MIIYKMKYNKILTFNMGRMKKIRNPNIKIKMI